jgi:putative ABC transport system permease protein
MALPSLAVLGLLTLICLVLGWAFSRENTRVPNDSWTRSPQTRQTSGWLWGGSAVTGIDPGFITRQTMTVPLDITVPPYTKTSALAFYRTLETRILQIPGVQSLAYGSLQPFRQVPPSEVRLSDQAAGHGRSASVDDVSAGFFTTFGIPLVHGRSFLPSDLSATASAPVAIVSTAFAKTFWGDDDPLGKTIVTPDDKHFVVIGVARDTRSEHFGMLDGPRLYTLRDPQSFNGQLFVRFNGDATPVAASIQQVVRSLDANQVDTPQTVWQSLETNAEQLRSLGKIIFFMAGIAVLLAIHWRSGSAYVSHQSAHARIWHQMVLGATRQSIFGSVMMRRLKQVALGLLGGLALAEPAAWMLMRLFRNSSMPVKTFDITVYSISALVLLVVSLLAMYLPAFRATQVDPIQALRNE